MVCAVANIFIAQPKYCNLTNEYALQITHTILPYIIISFYSYVYIHIYGPLLCLSFKTTIGLKCKFDMMERDFLFIF